MSELRRLVVDPGASRVELEILGSWRQERPDPESKERMLAALGVGLVAAPIATTVAGSVAPKAISTVGWLVWGKWIGIGVAALALAGGVAHQAMKEDPTVTLARSTISAPPIAAPVTPAPVVEIDTPANDTPAAPAQRSGSIARTSPAPVVSASLSEQVAAMDRARAALDSGDTKSAIALVDAYEARFSDGAFRQEAELVRVEALSKSGEHAKAAAAGKQFLQAYPKSPHAARVRALLAP